MISMTRDRVIFAEAKRKKILEIVLLMLIICAFLNVNLFTLFLKLHLNA